MWAGAHLCFTRLLWPLSSVWYGLDIQGRTFKRKRDRRMRSSLQRCCRFPLESWSLGAPPPGLHVLQGHPTPPRQLNPLAPWLQQKYVVASTDSSEDVVEPLPSCLGLLTCLFVVRIASHHCTLLRRGPCGAVRNRGRFNWQARGTCHLGQFLQVAESHL